MEDRRDLHALEHVLQLRSLYVPGRQHLFPAAASTLQASDNYHKQQQATRKAASDFPQGGTCTWHGGLT